MHKLSTYLFFLVTFLASVVIGPPTSEPTTDLSLEGDISRDIAHSRTLLEDTAYYYKYSLHLLEKDTAFEQGGEIALNSIVCETTSGSPFVTDILRAIWALSNS